jgi:hypothetical protein
MAVDKSPMAALEDTLDLYLVKKAPALPANVKELIVQFAPWITLVLLIVTLPAVLIALGLGALAAPLAFLLTPAVGVGFGVTYTLSMLVLAVSLVLEAMSIPGLFKRTAQGWRYVYFATLISIASSLLSLSVISGVFFGLIGLYFLFQIKSYYGTGRQEIAPTV